MKDSKIVQDWFNKANQDFRGASILFDADEYYLVAFHCQQAIEKTLKGYLIKNNIPIDKTHNLVILLKKAKTIDNSFHSFLKDCSFVHQFYIYTRYPMEIPSVVEQDEAKECLKIAQNLLEKTQDIKIEKAKEKNPIREYCEKKVKKGIHFSNEIDI